MRTESHLVAALIEQRPTQLSNSSPSSKPNFIQQTQQQLLGEVQTATKIINEVFIEASFHIQEFARLKNNTATSTQEQKVFSDTFRNWFNNEIRMAINEMSGANQSVACYVLKDRLDRFPIFDPQWTPPFVRNGTILENFLRSQSPVLLQQLGEVETLLTRHKTNATPAEKDTVQQWQVALNELSQKVAPHKTLKL